MDEDILEVDARLYGHCRAAHRLFDFCANCAGYTLRDEVVAWRCWGALWLAAITSPDPLV